MTNVTDETNGALRGWRDELRAGGRAKGTIDVRLSHVRRFLGELGKAPGAVTRTDVVAWLARDEWAPATRRSVRASLVLFFRWFSAANGGVNPAEDLPRVMVPRATPRPAPDYCVMQALRRSPAWVALAIELMATCGLRRAETASLKVSDFQPVGQGWVVRVVGKGGHVRAVPCPPRLALQVRKRGGGFVFPGGQAGHVSAGWLGKCVKRALDDDLTCHTLRHRFASVAYGASHDLRAVQELLGHASVATTQIYTRVSGDDVAGVAELAWKIAG